MTTEEVNKHNCESCGFRARAEEKPRSFLGIVWKLHTYICPGWKGYQRSLALQAPDEGPQQDAS